MGRFSSRRGAGRNVLGEQTFLAGVALKSGLYDFVDAYHRYPLFNAAGGRAELVSLASEQVISMEKIEPILAVPREDPGASGTSGPGLKITRAERPETPRAPCLGSRMTQLPMAESS
jgi:hypothetical protein